MKKRLFLIITICFIALLSFNVLAESGNTVFSWYCVRKKDHTQPKCDAEMSFIEDYDCYYIDKLHGDGCADKVVYLTFDAGYENGNVEKILDVLKEKDIKGAFFVLGNLIEKNSDLICRMFDEGHLVCNHTYRHTPMIGKSPDEIRDELSKLEKVCFEMTGKEMSKYYRPPEGKFTESTLKSVKDLGYKTVFWSFAYSDWDNNNQPSKEAALKKILDNTHPGEIMLLHPTSSTNAQILATVIDTLRGDGYRFGTLDELCKNES